VNSLNEVVGRITQLYGVKQYGVKFTILGGVPHVSNGKRPYVWYPLNRCASCLAEFDDPDDVVHYDEINNRVLCERCHGEA